MQNNVVLIPTHLIQSLLAFAKAHAHSADTLDQEGAEAAGTGPTPSRTPVGNAIPEVEALLAASKGGFADVAAVACLSTCHITAETNGCSSWPAIATLGFTGSTSRATGFGCLRKTP